MHTCTHTKTKNTHGSGQRLSAPCSGQGGTSPVTCVPCTASCGRGKRIKASSRCDGSGVEDVTCLNCSSVCAYDEYIGSECDGTGSEPLGCLPCKACAVGQYVAVQCEGTAKADVKVRAYVSRGDWCTNAPVLGA
jgi:hypothetical protein